MIIVTGGAGFIGSNIVKTLNQRERKDIIVVDDLTDGTKYKNLADCDIADYIDYEVFFNKIKNESKSFSSVEAIFHEGACSVTTEWNGRYMMNINFENTKTLFHYCLDNRIAFLYASSAAVYGGNKVFQESREHEEPLNVYGYSKMLFDHYMLRFLPSAKSQVVGFRYFNVYGPRESHKGSMASVAFHFNNQIKSEGVVKLFAACDGYGNGEQRRDFIFVGDVVDVNLWFKGHPNISGIFNVGTGHCQTFNDVANAVIAWHNNGKITYIPFPDNLRGRYQSFTEADITKLRQVGYEAPFKTVEEGVKIYLDWLNAKK